MAKQNDIKYLTAIKTENPGKNSAGLKNMEFGM